MTLDCATLEKWMHWVARNRDLMADRNQAWRYFFGLDDPTAIDYIGNTGNFTSREARFLGWYALNHTLPDGRLPVELAIEALVLEPKRMETRIRVRRARYLVGVVRETRSEDDFVLQSGQEHLKILAPLLVRKQIQVGEALVVHLISNGAGFWVAGPGWVAWPMRLSPTLRRQLRSYHFHPIQVERFLQGRWTVAGMTSPSTDQSALEEAVRRMTQAALETGEEALVMTTQAWLALVIPHLSVDPPNFQGFVNEIMARIRQPQENALLNRLFALAMRIWNETPQPVRGGKTATQLAEENQNASTESRSVTE